MDTLNELLHWNVLFIRPVHDWELDVVLRFFAMPYSQKIRYGGEDKICWIPSKKKTFEVKSYYQTFSTLIWVFGHWKVKAPSRVAFFVWIAALGKINILDNLQKQNVIVMELCYRCKQCEESIDHLLLHCEVAIEI